MLSGSAKEQFEEYVRVTYPDHYMTSFYNLPPSMQWGVYQDWADSLGIRLDVCSEYTLQIDYNGFLYKIHSHKIIDTMYYPYRKGEYKDLYSCAGFKTRQEARTAAIEKLNELINQ